jgi:hypothetical protein
MSWSALICLYGFKKPLLNLSHATSLRAENQTRYSPNKEQPWLSILGIRFHVDKCQESSASVSNPCRTHHSVTLPRQGINSPDVRSLPTYLDLSSSFSGLPQNNTSFSHRTNLCSLLSEITLISIVRYANYCNILHLVTYTVLCSYVASLCLFYLLLLLLAFKICIMFWLLQAGLPIEADSPMR